MSEQLHIAIDGNEANVPQRVGSNAYAYELLCELARMISQREDIRVTVLLSAEPLEDFPERSRNWQYRVVGPRALWTQIALPIHLFSHRKDYALFYTPGHYAPRLSPIPYISSVMDLAFLRYSKQFRKKDLLQLKEWTRYSVKGAAKIIAISEHTKQDVAEQYRIKKEKIVVVYPGISLSEKITPKEKEKLATLKKFKITQPYILYVGTLQPRKNLLRLIEAFELLVRKSQKNRELQLVIAGKVGWLASDILQRAKNSPLKNNIVLTDFITEKEKIILYKNSQCTVLVGLYEGFGIPALEALAYGSTPVVSETTSLPEVVGKAGVLVNPLDTQSIADGIQQVLNLPAKEKGKLARFAREQLKKFTWEKSAQTILDTIFDVIYSARKTKS
jgi:glycosyltransferase involved in cell wall biosynthesis